MEPIVVGAHGIVRQAVADIDAVAALIHVCLAADLTFENLDMEIAG